MPDACPTGCGCVNTFSSKEAEDDLRRYRRNGPDATTATLIDALADQGVTGATLLDVGGGIGAIQLELLAAGARSSHAVDASEAYAAVARREAERRGFEGRATVQVGDFVALAAEVAAADFVTLDRVVCCYSDADALLGAAAAHARRVVGLVYPRITWWTRIAAVVFDAIDRIRHRNVRWYLHPDASVDAVLERAGFVRHDVRRTLVWQVAIFIRSDGTAA